MSPIDRIRHAIGDKAAAVLFKSFGGRHLYVPLAASPNHSIARAIGIAAAVALSRELGGAYFGCPKTLAPGSAKKTKRSKGVQR
jgi:hypothetical protein